MSLAADVAQLDLLTTRYRDAVGLSSEARTLFGRVLALAADAVERSPGQGADLGSEHEQAVRALLGCADPAGTTSTDRAAVLVLAEVAMGWEARYPRVMANRILVESILRAAPPEARN